MEFLKRSIPSRSYSLLFQILFGSIIFVYMCHVFPCFTLQESLCFLGIYWNSHHYHQKFIHCIVSLKFKLVCRTALFLSLPFPYIPALFCLAHVEHTWPNECEPSILLCRRRQVSRRNNHFQILRNYPIPSSKQPAENMTWTNTCDETPPLGVLISTGSLWAFGPPQWRIANLSCSFWPSKIGRLLHQLKRFEFDVRITCIMHLRSCCQTWHCHLLFCCKCTFSQIYKCLSPPGVSFSLLLWYNWYNFKYLYIYIYICSHVYFIKYHVFTFHSMPIFICMKNDRRNYISYI